jgi:cysteine-S-conjugate beta-lyase
VVEATVTAVAESASRGRKWEVAPGRIGAWIAESDFGTAPVISRALHQAVDDGLLTYLPDRTAVAARTAFAAFALRRYGWHLTPERVHIVPDVLSALALTIQHLVRSEGPVVVPTPAYAPFLRVPEQLGRRVVRTPSRLQDGRWLPDLQAIDDAFAAGASLLVLCNPHNPLGTVLRPPEMRQLADIVTRHGGRVFADEIHAPIVFSGSTHVPYASIGADAAAHTVTATAASKGWNVPGLKSAQMILTSDADQRRWTDAELLPTHLGSVLGALAAEAAYSPSGEQWLTQVVARLERNRDLLHAWLADRLPDVRAARPEATYLAWIDFAGTGVERPAQVLAEHAGVVTSDGAECGPGHESAVRLNFAMQPDVLDRALGRIATAVRDRRRVPDLAG